MSKLFSVVGVSTNNGKTAFRVANDLARRKVLARNGHTDIKLIVLPQPMLKDDAIAFFTTRNIVASNSTRDTKGRFTKQAFQFVAA